MAPVRPSLLLAMGFRPFFLLAALHAFAAMAFWLLWLGVHLFGGMIRATTVAPAPYLWHGHEMLFGFLTAAMAGFMLTAVPNWTGTKPVSGGRLGVLVALWGAGRAAMWLSGALPASLVLAVDALFLPALALLVGPPVVRAGRPHNLVFVALLFLFGIANVVSHLGMMDAMPGGAFIGQRLAVDVAVVMMTIVGGRITPAFSRNWLRARGAADSEPATPGWLDGLTIAAAVAVLAGNLLMLSDIVRAVLAGAAAVLTVWRLLTWRGWRVRSEPLLWILHLGTLWLAVGFALHTAALVADAIPRAAALHAHTAGAAGTLVLGVMSRATLGHTARPLVATRMLTNAFVLVTAAALVRVVGPVLTPEWYLEAMIVAGLAWVGAFGLFLAEFSPVLLSPRLDGRPG